MELKSEREGRSYIGIRELDLGSAFLGLFICFIWY